MGKLRISAGGQIIIFLTVPPPRMDDVTTNVQTAACTATSS